jgi:hypothetical protein
MPEISIPDFDKVALAPPQLDPGEYTVNIYDKPALENSDNGKDYLLVKMKVVEGADQKEEDPATGSHSAVGRTINDRVYLVDGAYFRVKRLLIATGLLSRDDKDSDTALGRFNSDALQGARLRIKVVPAMVNGKEYRNVQYII